MGTNYYKRRNKYTDEELVEHYLKCDHSQIKAAKMLGVSRETVARTVRRTGIKMDGRKNNGYHENKCCGGLPLKATDEELLKASKIMDCIGIARYYSMSPERVYRRLKKLGISPAYGHGSHLGRIKAAGFNAEYDNTITLKELVKRDNGICQICGKPIDYNDIVDGHIRKNYPSIDHIVPLSKGGGHTWENVQLAHIGCNARKRDKIKEAVECHH